MTNRTGGRAFERSLQRTQTAARVTEQAHAAVTLLCTETEGARITPSTSFAVGGA